MSTPPRAGKALDAEVKLALFALTASYNDLTKVGRSPINYSSDATHLAYTYRCLSAHADCLFRTLTAAGPEAITALSANSLKIVCVGGGPGSDALGIIKYLEARRLIGKPVEFVFLDNQPTWSLVRNALFSTFSHSHISQKFRQTDLSAGTPWTTPWDFVDADLYTFSFVLSEVWAFNCAGSVSQFVDRLVSSAKKGALFTYSDNSGPNFSPHVDRDFGQRPDLRQVYAEDDTWMLIGSDEQASVMQAYTTRYGQDPKKTGSVNRRLWVKV